MDLKKIALNDVHQQLGAKMVPFAGYIMPLRYSSDLEEHFAVRNNVGVFDVSHMGEFYLRGPKALDLIQTITTNDASRLYNGKVQYSCLPNYEGGIVDDLLVYQISEEEYMLVVNAANIEKDWNWISQHNTEQVEMENASDQTSLFAVQGPKATDILQTLTRVNLSAMEYYSFQIAEFAGVSDVIISATGYTGAGGFEIYVKNQSAEQVWQKIFEAGAHLDIKPVGLGARDTLRLEMGYCLYGNDIDDTTSPLEAGLGWITKSSKTFINSENLRKQKAAGVSQKLTGLVMIDKGIPRAGYELFDENNNLIGKVTSGSQSPTLGKGIGLAYVQAELSKPGTTVFVNIRNRKLKAALVKPPMI